MCQTRGTSVKRTTLGTDRARNMLLGAGLLPSEHLPCAVHHLQRNSSVALKDSGLENVPAKSREIDGELTAQQTAHSRKSVSSSTCLT